MNKEKRMEWSQACIDCKRCVPSCVILRNQECSPKSILENFSQASPDPFTCMECHACKEACPKGIDFGELFVAQKKILTPSSSPLAFKKVLRLQQWNFSPLFSASKGHSPEVAFMPGCALANRSPELIEAILTHLGEHFHSVGYFQHCCGKPLRLIGDEEGFRADFQKSLQALRELSPKLLLTACSNCYTTFKKELPSLAIQSLYEVLEEIPLPRSFAPQPHKPALTLHDPCPSISHPELHRSVRGVLQKAGIPFGEFKNSKEKTLCCGSGGMLGLTHPALAKNQALHRAKESPTPLILTYCQSCADRLTIGGKKGVHLLEILYQNRLENRPLGFFAKWKNRFLNRWLQRPQRS